MLSAVSDSGPLIHLIEIKQLKLLNLFNVLIVPDSVLQEVGDLNLKNIKVVKVVDRDSASFIKLINKFKLQKAEIDALYLAKDTNSMFLTDDLEAREAANLFGINVHGSLGIIALAYKKQIISFTEAKQFILDLHNDSTLFLTKSLVDLAINELEKYNKI